MRPCYLARVSTTLWALAGWVAVAALAAAIWPLLLARRGADAHVSGLASALAAGAMLGVGYPLMSIGLARDGLLAPLGAVLGIATTWATHLAFGLGAEARDASAGRAVAAGALHAAPEGVAMGAAAAVGPRFGLFLVLTLALHNVWEGQLLGARLLAGGAGRGRAAALAVLANAPQVLLAVLAARLAHAMPAGVPLLLGFAFGALAYLCLAELLPESYLSTGRTRIAVVVSVAAGLVALLGGRAG